MDVIPARLGEETEREKPSGATETTWTVLSPAGEIISATVESSARLASGTLEVDPATIVRRDEGGALRAEDRGEGAELGGRGAPAASRMYSEYATPGRGRRPRRTTGPTPRTWAPGSCGCGGWIGQIACR